MRDNALTVALARLAGLPFALFGRRPFVPPRKALVLQPCCLSQVLLTTPLLAVLRDAYPSARFDWAVTDWARPAIAGNPHLTQLISLGQSPLEQLSWRELRVVAQRLRQEEYDTCFIPSRTTSAALLPWLAGIPQRIGLNVNGRGFAHTLPVTPPDTAVHAADVYLSLAGVLGIEPECIRGRGLEFYPADVDRTAVTALLVEKVDWLGDVPLVIIHPGGGQNPARPDERKQWPVERFALLGSQLMHRHKARVVLVGGKQDRPLTQAIQGMMAQQVVDLAGHLTLGELGALCEVADLYIGNDAGPTHVAVAVGCPTLAIFGPSNPVLSGPYAPHGRVAALWQEYQTPFDWDFGVTVEEGVATAVSLLTT
jgi:lipopolysaccharide heptosyltransferase II